MPVQGSMQSLTAVAASNSPAGTDAISNTLDDYLRSFAGILRHTQAQAATLTATASMSLAAATGEYVPVDCAASLTSAASVSHLGTVDAGIRRTLLFDGYAKLIHGANLLLPGSATIVTVAGDVAEVISDGAGAWRLINHHRPGLNLTTAAAYVSLAGNILLQFGTATTAASGTVSVSFATDYGTANLSVVASGAGSAQTTTGGVKITTTGTGGFTGIYTTVADGGAVAPAAGVSVWWMSLGY